MAHAGVCKTGIAGIMTLEADLDGVSLARVNDATMKKWATWRLR